MQPKRRGRGRPAGDTSDHRAAIIEAARHEFGQRGYRATTLRSVGRAAAVDARLVLHYFGSKQNLFLASIQLPIDPAQIIERVFAAGIEDAPARAAEFMVDVLDDAARRDAFVALLRAAVTEPEAADLIRLLLTEQLLQPIASRIGADQPRLRAGMVASQVVGLAIVRHVIGLEPLAAATRDQLIGALTPMVAHYLTGEWPNKGTIGRASISENDDSTA